MVPVIGLERGDTESRRRTASITDEENFFGIVEKQQQTAPIGFGVTTGKYRLEHTLCAIVVLENRFCKKFCSSVLSCMSQSVFSLDPSMHGATSYVCLFSDHNHN
ncbi:hypothetical protein AB6A40_003593 [Gnathostoma spinigerum]|uniref:Uncharacterized protein n=1 Tax=Gnathostoma spinigerum TaxID=75299 RepID=A0ABD6EFJ7_9BILA